MIMAYQRIAKLIPAKVAEQIRRNLRYTGIKIDAEKFLGFLLAYGLAISFAVALIVQVTVQLPFLIVFFFVFLTFFGGVYLWLSLRAESKGRFVEGVLPDALQLIASNIKSGMTTERALFVSARPEFGPLEEELKNASKQILAGETLEHALEQMGANIKSTVFQRTMWLIARGIQSGGQIADLLIQLGDDIREQKGVQDESRAETSMYILLIFIASAFGSPILFGISSFIVQILTSQLTNLTGGGGLSTFADGAGGGGNMGVIVKLVSGERHGLSPAFVVNFSIIALFATSIFASLTLGVINSGKEKNGIKFIPFILLVGLGLFFLIRIVLQGVFGDLLKT
ncbi:MAG: type II secretion system F family protein [Candidatus Diapherotrites archaeon]|nr:type II secretion system F family protein [Candidatus Diapherotrites archaeon]